ncbi:uncharacterized protein LOC132047231 isoform X1 [Lycium ferocissimum]|uniref:uncharacterized protein LOC132047231 isoform X1 n=2 Tax=Lycium ferocissimum TaxID=112874 RepID=UPI0028154A65|nr:uncharacterized protein LOC132047231 isoform X1 [Lycium ferocissimum]
MNTSQYMDKQIMDLTNSQNSNNNNDFIDLANPQVDQKKEDIVPSYEFHPIRPITGSSSPKSNVDSTNVAARAWNSADSKNNNTTESSIRNYGSLDSTEPTKVIVEKDLSSVYSSLLSEIDHTVKKYTDSLLHAMEGVSARLSQLETRSRQIDNSVDELRLSVGNNHGVTDGKLRQLENILTQVQDGVQVIKDKQDIMDAQLKLMKSQAPKVEQQAETHNITHVDSAQPTASAPLQSHQNFTPVALTQPPSTVPPPNAPPPPPQQNLPYQVQPQNQYPQNPIPSHPQSEAYYPPAGQAPENISQLYQQPAPQQHQTPPPPPHQQYQPAPPPMYSQPPPPLPAQPHPPHSSVNPSQPQTLAGHHREEMPFVPSQTYPPANIRQQPSHPSSGAPPSQQLYGTPPNMFEPQSSRPGPGYSGAYGPSSVPGEPYPYSSSPGQYGSGSSMKPPQVSLPAMSQSGSSGYQQLPTARILPQALPTASAVSSGSSSPRTGNRVPIDDVVDKVTNMGFSRDQVRTTVRRLTESGQAVDLNTVLDKLMNDGEVQPPRGWFGR